MTTSSSFAINASPLPFEVEQADGSIVTLYIRGDEYFSWLEDPAGYTVVHAGAAYEYAELDKNGNLQPSGLLVGKVDPAAEGLEKRALPPNPVRQQKRFEAERIDEESRERSGAPETVAPLGTVKNLVVPIRFTNHTSRTLPSVVNMNNLFNGDYPAEAPTGSVQDVYAENSYGQFNLVSTVNNWVNVPQSEQYYANGNSGLDERIWQALTAALASIDASVDFDQFDADNDNWIDSITFLHSGYAAESGGTDSAGVSSEDRIWSHRWTMTTPWTSAEGVRVGAYHISPALWGTSGSEIGRVGVICHETGHFFGLPDLYDTTKPGDGIGSWGLMANSWGFDYSQQHPPHFSAWSKILMGWTTPTVLNNSGVYSIRRWAQYNEVYRINYGFPSNEYLLIENRQPYGIESAIPQGGLTVFHVDDDASFTTQGYPGQSGWPGNGNHYRVAVLQADGDYDLELGNNRGDAGDTYHGNGVDTISPDTSPSTDRYQSGIVADTGITLSQISASGATMTFRFSKAGETLNQSPNTPTGISPVNGATGLGLSVTMGASSFSDPDTGDTHAASRWQFTDDRTFATLDWDYIDTDSNKTSEPVPSNKLTNGVVYFWRVKYQDNQGGWSGWSPWIHFTTAPPPNRAPNTPSGLTPTNGSTGVSTTTTLTASSFSDSDSGDSLAASRWQLTDDSSFTSLNWDHVDTDGNRISEPVPQGKLSNGVKYYWRVKYKDNHGAWSNWSSWRNFTTTQSANRPPITPYGYTPANNATNISLTVSLGASQFADPDLGDSAGSSRWQLTDDGSFSGLDWDYIDTDSNKTFEPVPTGKLKSGVRYYWRVKYMDNHGAWSGWSNWLRFTTAAAPNRAPYTPSGAAPPHGATNISAAPSITGSLFSDPDPGDSQAASRWQLTEDSTFASLDWDYVDTDGNRISEPVPQGKLSNGVRYYWRVKYQDNHGAWSAWSAWRFFTTASTPNSPPITPYGLAPSNGATGIILSPLLFASSFSDPDFGDTHASSWWQLTSDSSFASIDWEHVDTDGDKSGEYVPSGVLSIGVTYYWRVRYQDSRFGWSAWSGWSSFTTGSSDDNYEDNDTLNNAYDLSYDEAVWLRNIDGYGIQADEDWYRIDVTPGYQRVIVSCTFSHNQGDIDIVLYEPSGNYLAFSNSATDDENIDYIVPSGGTYYVRVYYGNGGNAYDLWWDDVQPAKQPDNTQIEEPNIESVEIRAVDEINARVHSADINGDYIIDLGETMRVLQFRNLAGFHCANGTEDGFAPGPGDCSACEPHDSDFVVSDCAFDLQEIMRLVQILNSGSYTPCPDAETDDGFCVGKS